MKQFIMRVGLCCAGMLVIWCLRAQPVITRVEYYFDNDPGYGKATAVGITPAANLSNIGININPATLSSGVHTFGIRAKDANNAWSQDNRWLFAKPYPDDTAASRPDVSRVEYYFDNDPGYGKATAVSITPGGNLADIAININPSTLSTGVQVFGIRAKDSKGAWCLTTGGFLPNLIPMIPPFHDLILAVSSIILITIRVMVKLLR